MFLWPNVVLFTPILCNLCKEKKMVEIEKVESRKSDTIKVMKFYHVSVTSPQLLKSSSHMDIFA